MEVVLDFYHQYKNIILIVIILFGAVVLNKIIRFFLTRYFDNASRKLKVDPTQYHFFKNMVSFFVWGVALIGVASLIPELKQFALTIFAGAGILAAIVGFASQQAFSNIVSGIFIVIFKPFRVGDLIKIGDLSIGEVEDITLWHTIIVTLENRRIVIPNSVIGSETILNSSIGDQKVCMFVEIGISYDSDINLAMRLMQEEALKHPNCIDNRNPEQITAEEPQVVVRTIGFGDSSVNLRAYVWATDPVKGILMKFDLHKSIKERFDKEGVEIPFPYRTIVYKKDLEAEKSANGKEEKKT